MPKRFIGRISAGSDNLFVSWTINQQTESDIDQYLFKAVVR